MIAALLVLLAATILGAPYARLADRDAPPLRWFGVSLLFGTGIAATLLLILGLAGVGWSRAIVFGGFAVIFAVGVVLARKLTWRIVPRIGDVRTLLFDAITGLTLFGYARFATVSPMWELDFIDNWGLKGRVFWHARGFDWSFLTNPFYRWSHQDYPPLVPLTFDLVALAAGSWEDRWVGLYYVATAVALLALIRSILAEEIGSLRAAAATLALTCVIASPWPGLADGPLVAYGTAAVLLLRRSVRFESRSALYGSAVLFGFAALTKNEGISLTVAAAIALFLTSGWRNTIRLWPAAILAAPWIIARAQYDLATDLTTGSVVGRLIDHLRDPSAYIDNLIRYAPGQPLLWLGIAVGLIAGIGYVIRHERLILTTVAIQLLFYLGAYLVTPLDVAFHIRWSWDRLVWHLTPSLAFVSLLAVSHLAWPDEREPRSPESSTERSEPPTPVVPGAETLQG